MSTTKKLINQLMQLQDMIEARAQQQALLAGNGRLDSLDESINAMMKELPFEIESQFVRLQKKSHVAICSVSAGSCAGCGMSLPVSLVHEVHAAADIYHCPNCSRFLYYPDEPAPRRPRQQRLRAEPVKAGIARFSAPELMLTPLQATTADAALAEIAGRMAEAGFVDQGARLAEEASKREAIVSTAVENGLAFPHVRGVEGGGLTLALGVSRKGVKFNPAARPLTRLFFFVAIPTAASAFYLKLLSGLTRTFSEDEARERLLAAETPDALWKALLQTTRKTIP